MLDDIDSVDRPATKTSGIEVTPEMIAAGVAALAKYAIDGDLGSSIECWESAVISVFRVMALRIPGLRLTGAEDH